MRNGLLLICCMFLCCNVGAVGKQGNFLSLKINYSNPPNHLKNIVSINTEDHHWKIMGRMVSQTSGDTLLLLAKLDGLKNDKAKMEFLVVNLTRRADFAFEVKMKLRLGKERTLVMNKQNQQMRFSVMADKMI